MEISHASTFTKSAAGIFSEEDLFELELALLIHPTAGALIPGGRGLRKLRRPLTGRGKRGGARVIYYFATTDEHILLLYAYAKNRHADLSKSLLKQLTQLLETELP